MSAKKYNAELQKKVLDFLTLSEGWGGENTLPFNFDFVNLCAEIAVHLGNKYPWEAYPTMRNSIQFETSLYNKTDKNVREFYFEFEIYSEDYFKESAGIEKVSYLFVKEQEYQNALAGDLDLSLYSTPKEIANCFNTMVKDYIYEQTH